MRIVRRVEQYIIGTQVLDGPFHPMGIVGGVKWFLFRKVPRDSSWWHTLGSATLTAFLVQAVTGVILAMYYEPSAAVNPKTGLPIAYESIQHISNDLTLGWLVRGMHRWGASVFIILMFFHMRGFLFGAYKYPRELNWIIGVLLLALGCSRASRATCCPGTNTVTGPPWSGYINGTPLPRPFISLDLRGGAEIGPETLSRFYSLHCSRCRAPSSR